MVTKSFGRYCFVTVFRGLSRCKIRAYETEINSPPENLLSKKTINNY